MERGDEHEVQAARRQWDSGFPPGERGGAGGSACPHLGGDGRKAADQNGARQRSSEGPAQDWPSTPAAASRQLDRRGPSRRSSDRPLGDRLNAEAGAGHRPGTGIAIRDAWPPDV